MALIDTADTAWVNTADCEPIESVKAHASARGQWLVHVAARHERLANLGLVPTKAAEIMIAVDVSLGTLARCQDVAAAEVRSGLELRKETAVLRGESVMASDSPLALYHIDDADECSSFQTTTALADQQPSPSLRRFEEVTYLFQQHSAPVRNVQFPEE